MSCRSRQHAEVALAVGAAGDTTAASRSFSSKGENQRVGSAQDQALLLSERRCFRHRVIAAAPRTFLQPTRIVDV